MAASLALLLAGTPAAAQPSAEPPAPSPLQVVWKTNDVSCAGGGVGERAAGLVTAGVVPRPLSAQVDVERQGDEWLVRIETRSADGEHAGRREFRAESCEHLEQAVALLLAMTLESRESEALLPASPAPSTEPAAPPAPPPPEPTEPEQDQPPAPEAADTDVDLGGFLRLDGRAGVGLKPGLALGTGLAGGLRLGAFDIGVTGAYWPVTREPVPGSPDAYVLIQRASAGLRACWNFTLGEDFRLAPCLIPEAVLFIVGSEGVVPNDGPSDPIPSITGSLELRYALAGERLSLLLGAAVTAEQRQPFRLLPNNVDGTADAAAEPVPVYETKGVGPRLEIGLDARF